MSILDAARSCFYIGYRAELPLLNASISDKMATMVEKQTKIAENSEKVANRMDVMTMIILAATVITMILALLPCAGDTVRASYQFWSTAFHQFAGLL